MKMNKNINKVVLKNGLQVIIEKDASCPLVSVAVFVRVGAVDESVEVSGLSHFVEHLLFKGSKNFPQDSLSRNVENSGGYINAATSKEYTCYYINTQKSACTDTIKMLADITQNPNFPADEIEKERGVVLEEIARHFDDPHSVLFDMFTQTLYKKSAYKNSIIGTAKVIKNVSREKIIEYFKTHYIPQKMTVAVVGDINPQKIKELLNQTFGKISKGIIPKSPQITEPKTTPKTLTKKARVEHAYMLSGFLGPCVQSPDIYTADVAMYILGGSRASRLYSRLRDGLRLVYSISGSFMSVKGTGTAYISSAFNPKNKTKVIKAINAEVENIIKNGITPEELFRAKLSIKTDWNFLHETFSERAYNAGYWNVIGGSSVLTNYLSGIERISVGDVKAFFKKYAGTPKGAAKISSAVLLPDNRGKSGNF